MITSSIVKNHRQEQELRNMTPEEEKEKVEAEIQPEVSADAVQLVSDVSAAKLRAVEGTFHDKVRKCFDSSYRLLVKQILGTAEYDAILQPLRSKDPDFVIEVKYIRRGFKYAWLRESAMRLALANELYDARLKRRSIPLLIVILSADEVFQQPDVKNAREKTQFDLRQRDARLRIEYVSEIEIQQALQGQCNLGGELLRCAGLYLVYEDSDNGIISDGDRSAAHAIVFRKDVVKAIVSMHKQPIPPIELSAPRIPRVINSS
jgi:hypothetical protein